MVQPGAKGSAVLCVARLPTVSASFCKHPAICVLAGRCRYACGPTKPALVIVELPKHRNEGDLEREK